MSKRTRPAVTPVDRRAISRREREARYRRRLYTFGGIVLALIVGIFGFGLFQMWVLEPASPVATVNGVPIRTDTYQRWVQYRRYELRNYMAQLNAQLGQLDPEDEDDAGLYSFFEQQWRQLEMQMASLPTLILDSLIDDELIRQEAQRRNLVVTAEEVQKDIEQSFGYNLDVPTPAPEPTAAPGDEAQEPSPTPLPSPTPMSEESFKEFYGNYIQTLQKNAGFTEADFRGLVSTSLLRSTLQEAMAAEVPTSAEQVRARHILLDDEEDAKAALERIRKGEDFAAVAQEISTDTASKEEGGDLGWFPRGQMLDEFEAAAFALQPGEVSDVVATMYGYHIIKVEEREAERPMEESMLAQRRSMALQDWLEKQRADPLVVKRFWSLDKVPKEKLPVAE